MSEWQFAEPQWAHALWGVAAAAIALLALDRRGGRALSLFLSPIMQKRLVEVPSALRRGLRMGLLILALLASVLALMRPQWGSRFVQSRQVGAEIMIALDVSRSMLAEDVAPNRLERAKAEIRDLLPYLVGDQVGLIAFAGRASVLCPLTPDFGFLRLVLDSVDPGSVSRGGTRLEEPIRKATAGFGASGDLARVILLITDGEDHESFPLDAAREAAERGIRILAIGFGDEGGSEIWLTDPDTGARTRLTDADGHPVRSRLDGELLRELALQTEGAYVPAGTGVLDLESIFEAHIRPLMRAQGEERGRTVREDGFQWAILVALLALLGSVLAQGGRGALLTVALLILSTQPMELRAQPAGGAPAPTASAADAPPVDPRPADPLAAEGGGEARDRLELPEDPREAFNRGLAALEEGDLDDAEQLLESARRGARSDGEVRFRAGFDLSWVEVRRADASLESEPEAALAALERAADWLRESIALRPESEDARRNLEIVLKRAMLLADSIAARRPDDVETRLDALIEAQRGATTRVRGALETAAGHADPSTNEPLRAELRALGVTQRQILADAGALADAAGRELDGLRDAAEDERTPQQQLRLAQLEGVLHYVHRARERMGQARSLLRRGQPGRAHRRAADSLSNLKRAREQLQDPVQLLDGLVGDAARSMEETSALATAQVGVGVSVDGDTPAAQTPAWLDAAYLGEAQRQIADRVLELHAKLEASSSGLEASDDPQQQALAESIQAATPRVGEAVDALDEAADRLANEELTQALEPQGRGLRALVDAREHFLDLKGLIEVAFADQTRIEKTLESDDPDVAAALAEYAPALRELQSRNLERVIRLAPMIEKLGSELERPPGEGEAAPSEQSIERGRQRIELAEGLLALTESAMRGAVDSFEALADDAAAVDEARARVDTSVRGLDGLRRLFFSIVEHIRDAARRQVELADESEAAAGRDTDARHAAFERLADREQELGDGTDALAGALHEQSMSDPAAALGRPPSDDPTDDDEAADQLMRASEKVLAASDAMRTAAEGLRADAADGVREQQTTAVQRLAEALAILEPPQPEQPEPDPSKNEKNDQDQQEQTEQQAAQQAEEPQAEPEPVADPSQMLQAVRDREAERHRERRTRREQGYEPVEKDW